MILWAIAHAYAGIPGGEKFTAIALAFMGLSATIPTLAAAVFSGALADRFDRRRLMQVVNLAALAGTASIGVVLYLRPSDPIGNPAAGAFYLPLWIVLVYPLWAGVTTAVTIFRPAFNASLPKVVGRAELGSANGLIYATAVALLVVASLLAGEAVAWVGAAGALVFSLGLFGATSVALLGLRADLAPRREVPPRRFLRDALEGYRYLVQRVELLELTLSALAVNFFSAIAFVELALYVNFWLGLQQALFISAMLSAGSLGSATGTLLINRWKFEGRAGRFLALFTLLQGLSVVLLAVVRSPWLALPTMFLFGVFPGMFTTVFLATIQATVPDDRLGRVLAADEVGSYGLVPVGQYAGGVVTAVASVQVAYLTAGLGTIGVGALMAGFRALRRLGFSTAETAAPRPPAEAGAEAPGPSS